MPRSWRRGWSVTFRVVGPALVAAPSRMTCPMTPIVQIATACRQAAALQWQRRSGRKAWVISAARAGAATSILPRRQCRRRVARIKPLVVVDQFLRHFLSGQDFGDRVVDHGPKERIALDGAIDASVGDGLHRF